MVSGRYLPWTFFFVLPSLVWFFLLSLFLLPLLNVEIGAIAVIDLSLLLGFLNGFLYKCYDRRFN